MHVSRFAPCLASVAAILLACVSRADTHYWAGGSGEWGVFINWSPWGIPGNGDYCYIQSGAPITVQRSSSTVSYSYPGPFTVELDGSSGALVTLDQSANNMYASYESIGVNGRARYAHHGGLNYVDQGLLIANGAGAVGTYTIDTVLASLYAQTVEIARASGAAGTFVHSQGTVSIGSGFNLATAANSTATYRNTAGILHAFDTRIGAGGAGTFTQDGGIGTLNGNCYIGSAVGGSGTLEILAGTLTVSGSTYVGSGGSGTLELWGSGRMNAQNGLTITSTASSVAWLYQPGGTLVSNGDITIRGGRWQRTGGRVILSTGRAIRITDNGAFNTSSELTLSANTGVVITSGSMTASYALNVGSANTASLSVDGTSASVITGTTAVGFGTGGIGTVGIRNGASGTFLNLEVGNQGGVGSVTVSGASTVRMTADLTLGQSGGAGYFNQSGGTTTVSHRLFMGTGSLGSSSTSSEVGRLAISGGTFNVGSAAYVSGLDSADGPATITLSGAGVFSSPSLSVFGPGRVVQSGGTLSADMLTMRGGQLSLNGGSLLSKRIEFYSGTISHSGGTALCDRLWIGVSFGSSGTGGYILSGTGALNVTVNGAGIGGDTTASYGTGVLTIAGGTANIAGVLKVHPGSTVNYSGGTLSVASLDISTGGKVLLAPGTSRVLRGTRLVIAGTGLLDLSDNAMVVDYNGATPLATIRSYIQTGYAGGAWNGNAITSSTAAATTGRAIGFSEASTLFTTFPAAFQGQTVDSTSVLLLYTLSGDANLDRMVNIADFARLAAKFNQPANWADGDFNYDGTTGIGDFSLLAANFNENVPDRVDVRAEIPEALTGWCGLAVIGAWVLSRRRTPDAGGSPSSSE